MSSTPATAAALTFDDARELTVLAWRRTILRLVIVVVVGTRLFVSRYGPVLVLVTFATVAFAALLNLAASRAYSSIRTGSGLRAPRLPAAVHRADVRLAVLGIATAVFGLVAFVWVAFSG